ncbi:MAG: SPASM domain-containing protein [Bacteroidales bacterium]|nr:SPASM domain-containing protein [Bacteroidales bacterium]
MHNHKIIQRPCRFNGIYAQLTANSVLRKYITIKRLIKFVILYVLNHSQSLSLIDDISNLNDKLIASVRIDGAISACGSIRADYNQGNIYTDDFIDVWENRFQPYRDRSWMRQGACADCKYFRYCQGNGMHLRDDEGNLILCHLSRL